LRQGSLSPTSLRYAVAAGTEGGGGAPFFAVLTGAFLAVFLAAGACWALAASAASALTLAQRLRLTSAMAFLPAALSFRYDAKKKGATICPMRRVVCQLPQPCGA
jgi:hypothetical protein